MYEKLGDVDQHLNVFIGNEVVGKVKVRKSNYISVLSVDCNIVISVLICLINI